ncbi:acyl-CoA dehydrogenase family protein [Musicola paradisiaca]|uniref:Acyl-CoA dehydrogenase domain protein n=1 Tax=Musicola paradisiaca (strain Ech703) TaxID=579405 RepID=C6C6K6_MUSP7|nr:acyl-CoA dehydrogenase [Musicola paradisiaca]ACS83925.1 acyl-CoA dehydrogenase domain protein [Musicola paradisiaca Ech703]
MTDYALFLQPLKTRIESTLDEGRHLGGQIDIDPEKARITAGYSLAPMLNTLGVPADYRPQCWLEEAGVALNNLSLPLRCEAYESFGYIDPNLLFSSPGPGMAAMVVDSIGSQTQRDEFFSQFSRELTWSSFAMSEPNVGSDVQQLQTRAVKVDGGWLINGEKYLIGNGVIADTGVLFARTAPGPLGINVFIFSPRHQPGIAAERIPIVALPGCNVSHLRFHDLFLPDSALLGQHLKPTERFARSALITFDALRPCVGAIALGIARSALDMVLQHRWTTPKSVWLQKAQRQLQAAMAQARAICERLEQGEACGREAGLIKVVSTRIAEQVIMNAVHHAPPAALGECPRLAKAWRDVKALEYTEGTTFIHLLNHGYRR